MQNKWETSHLQLLNIKEKSNETVLKNIIIYTYNSKSLKASKDSVQTIKIMLKFKQAWPLPLK